MIASYDDLANLSEPTINNIEEIERLIRNLNSFDLRMKACISAGHGNMIILQAVVKYLESSEYQINFANELQGNFKIDYASILDDALRYASREDKLEILEFILNRPLYKNIPHRKQSTETLLPRLSANIHKNTIAYLKTL